MTESARYQVIAKLGHGGMSRVYLMLSRGSADVKKLLVTKELSPELKEEPEFVTMFIDEARLALRLNHPNVIQTYEVSGHGRDSMIVMEYLEGQTLGATIRRVTRPRFPVGLHLHILAEVLAGLDHAHELCDFDGTPFEVVHRDVSPSNVFLTYDGQVKLVDFGIAKASYTERTRAGVFKGKAAYAAPEQIRMAAVDRRTDVFSIGIMMWEALAQQRITANLPEIAMMQRRLSGADPSILDVLPDAPPEAARICMKAMAANPDERYASAAAMRSDLLAYLESTGTHGARQLAALMVESFAEERAQIRQQIDVRVKEVSAAAGTASTLAEASARGGSEAPSMNTQGRTALTNDTDSSAGSHRKTNARPLRWIVGGGVACAAVAFGVYGWRSSRPPPPEPAAARTSAPAPSEARSAEPMLPPSAAPAATTVDVAIAVTPAEATIFVDDVMLANPYRGKMPRSGESHRIRCAARGFTPEERTVRYDADVDVHVALKPLAVPEPTPRGITRFPAPHPVVRDPPPARPATPSAPAPVATAPAAWNPGDAITPGTTKRPRSIDDKL